MSIIKKNFYPTNEILKLLHISKKDLVVIMIENKLPFYKYIDDIPIISGVYKYNIAPPLHCSFGKILLNLYKHDDPSWSHLTENTYKEFRNPSLTNNYVQFSVPNFTQEQICVETIAYKDGVKEKLVFGEDYRILGDSHYGDYLPNRGGYIHLYRNIEDKYISISTRIEIESLEIEQNSNYYRVPDHCLQKFLHKIDSKIRLEYFKREGNKFCILAESKIHSLPEFTLDDLYVGKDTLKELRKYAKLIEKDESSTGRHKAQIKKRDIIISLISQKYGPKHKKDGHGYKSGELNVLKISQEISTALSVSKIKDNTGIIIGLSVESIKDLISDAIEVQEDLELQVKNVSF